LDGAYHVDAAESVWPPKHRPSAEINTRAPTVPSDPNRCCYFTRRWADDAGWEASFAQRPCWVGGVGVVRHDGVVGGRLVDQAVVATVNWVIVDGPSLQVLLPIPAAVTGSSP